MRANMRGGGFDGSLEEAGYISIFVFDGGPASTRCKY